MDLIEYINNLGEWVLANLDKIMFSVVAVVAVFIIYRLVIREIRRLKVKGRLEEHIALTLTRIIKWAVIAVVFSAVLA